MSYKGFLTSGQVTRLLGVSESTVQRWDTIGRLPAVRLATSNRRLFPVEAVEALLRQAHGDMAEHTGRGWVDGMATHTGPDDERAAAGVCSRCDAAVARALAQAAQCPHREGGH